MAYTSSQRPPRDAHWLPRKEYLALKMRSAMMGTTTKEILAEKTLGYDPSEVRQKGVTGTMTANVIRALLGVKPPMSRMPEALAEEPEEGEGEGGKSRQLQRIRRAILKNLRANEAMLGVMRKVLTELVILRKVTEGRVKFNVKGGNYTRELTTKEIKKRTRAGLTGPTTSFVGIKDLITPAATQAKPARKPWERTEDENNENKDRDTSVKEAVKASFGSSGIDDESAERLQGSDAADDAPKPPAGGAGGAIAGMASGLLGSLLARGVLRRGATRAATRAGTRVGARVAARGLARTALKKIPVIGLLAGVGFGIQRMMRGDMLGAAGELASGAASTIPGVGTAASIGIDAAMLGRDMKRDQAQAEIERNSPDTASMLEQTAPDIVATSTPIQQIVNNNNVGGGGGSSRLPVPDVRPTSNSFMRFQDRRQVRVL